MGDTAVSECTPVLVGKVLVTVCESDTTLTPAQSFFVIFVACSVAAGLVLLLRSRE